MTLELNRIYCMDCLEGMKQMSDKSVDLTVTSPPYNNLREYKGYSFNFEETAKELYRVTKDGGVVVWVVGDATINGSETGTSFKQALYFKEIGFNLHDTMIYHRQGCFPMDEHYRYWQDFEYMFIFSKGKPLTFNPIKKKSSRKAGSKIHRRVLVENVKGKSLVSRTAHGNKSLSNVWHFDCGGNNCSTNDKEAFGHPAIFPEELSENHILSWSNEGDLVLDPFSGSGTTAKIAIINERQFIGFEISSEYCEIAEKRIKKAQEQGKISGWFE